MHPVAHEVEIPIEQVERELEKRAIPGFTGSVTVFLRVRPEAGLNVSFSTEQTEVKRPGKSPVLSPDLFGDGRPTERQLKVRQELAREKHRFRLVTTVTKVTADYVDGDLRVLNFVSVSEKWPI